MRVARWFALAGLGAALTVAVPAAVAGRGLPACSPGPQSSRPPTGPAGPGTPGACRAAGPILEKAGPPDRAKPATSGYHHLGAGTSGEWGGVSGRYSVVDSTVRTGTYDFVAARFMAKREIERGRIAWLEAGWARTGWSGGGRPRVYTFNTNTNAWQFYDQYAVKTGDRVWLDVHTDGGGVWSAWLWWNNRWNLLTSQKLPVGETAYIEQYVEVHGDPKKPARLDLPRVTVDNVQLRPAGGGASRFWREDVPTVTGVEPGLRQVQGGFCLDWVTRYDTWAAGDC
ncbi:MULTISPECIES: hypothetical protein [Actinoplanes]|uniref:hypothetical protein n=1 Tax=Actinoplanes TaxID=1865 RepID=UPI000A5BA27E|nr:MULTISPECIES: hypothetical protein [Actinoplanes]GLY05782.1 hypothetical protein Acsp01_61610 [Actinoplanes sp. NBRC 101535]